MRPALLGPVVLLGAAITSSAYASVIRPGAHSSPGAPVLVAPAMQSTVTSMPPQLTVGTDDPNGDSLTVTFYGRPVTAATGPDFTLVEIPDTQYYSASLHGGSPAIFASQTSWIAANRVIRNIAYVGHVGDIVEDGENGGDPTEWRAADAAMRLLEDPDSALLPDGVPYGVSAGNHDLGPNGNPSFNQWFGVSRFAGRSYYGGHLGGDNNNWFDLFSASGLDFVVIGLGLTWLPDPVALHWADSVLTAHPDRRAIVVSHYLLDPGPPPMFSPQGQGIYDALKGHTNLILMICGHYVNEARRADTYNGHTIYTVMSNYQNLTAGGDGWLRIMEFSPAHNQIRMRTYSPWLGQYRVLADSSSQFTLDCDLSGGDGAFHPIATFRRVAAGSTLGVPWAGLMRGQTYEWYATVSDGSTTVTGPTWRFDTVENIPPTVAVTAPDGGEILTMGQQTVLQWSAADASGVSSVDLQVSRSGAGGPWATIASNIPNLGAFNWWVIGPATNNAYLRVAARDPFDNEGLATSDAAFSILEVTGVGDGSAATLALEPVSPNPMRGASRFGVVLPAPGRIVLDILDLGGREVAVLADGLEPAGRREFAWDGSAAHTRAPAGLYVARLRAADRVLTRRFVLAP